MSRTSRYDPARRPRRETSGDTDAPSAWMRTRSFLREAWRQPRQRLYLLGGAGVVIAGLLTWILWPAAPAPEPPRARQYLAFTACLLTDQHGVQGPDAAPVWAGMQDASLKTRAKVQYLEVSGPQTPENAATFVNSLAQGKCDQVFAAGSTQAEATVNSAGTFPKVKFYVVGKRTGPNNLSILDARTPEAIRSAVADTITSAVNRSGR